MLSVSPCQETERGPARGAELNRSIKKDWILGCLPKAAEGQQGQDSFFNEVTFIKLFILIDKKAIV